MTTVGVMFAIAVGMLGVLPLEALDMTERLWAPWRMEYVQGGADAPRLRLLRQGRGRR